MQRPLWHEALSACSRCFKGIGSCLLSGHAVEHNSIAVEYKNKGTSTVVGSENEDKLVVFQNHSSDSPSLPSNSQKEFKLQNYSSSDDINQNMVLTRIPNIESALVEMKQELLQSTIRQQNLEMEKDELTKLLSEKEQQVTELKRELNARDRLLHQQKNQFDDAVKNLSLANRVKATLTSQLADQDRKIAMLEDCRSSKPQMREELQVARDALHSLRTSFKGNDPHHHTIDSLEQCIALLMERLHFAELQKIMGENGELTSKKNFLTSYSGYQLSRLDRPSLGGIHYTKVVYFTERAVTPFMSSIPKRLGEICLLDFKSMFDRLGNFRYHFKSVDPEYGMVKEEILHDEDILPGWDGKIVAWVEEDHG